MELFLFQPDNLLYRCRVINIRDYSIELKYLTAGAAVFVAVAGFYTLFTDTSTESVYSEPGNADQVDSLGSDRSESEPWAEFTVVPSEPVTGEEVVFDASPSSDDGRIVIYEWDLDGDGEYSPGSQEVRRKVFDRSGRYDVGLRVVDDDKNQKEVRKTVHVYSGEYRIDFAFTPEQPDEDDEIGFEAILERGKEETVDSYSWDFDSDGDYEAEGAVVEHEFEPGEHKVSLKVSGSSGEEETEKAISVESTNEDPEAGISFEPGHPLVGEEIIFDASGSTDDKGIEKLEWDLDGDEEYEKTGSEVSETFDSKVSRKIRLRATDSDGETDVAERTLNVNSRKVEVELFLNESEDITASEYQEFLGNVSSQLEESGGINVTFEVVSAKSFSQGENCVGKARWDQREDPPADVTICAGKDEGGFWGSRINIIGHNTHGTNEFGSSEDIHTTAHEWIHYFGFQDVYGYPSSMPKNWIDTDIMSIAVYSENPTMSSIQKDMVKYNKEQLLRKNRKAIYYRRMPDNPSPPDFRRHRMPDGTSVNIELPSDRECEVREIKNGDTQKLGNYSTGSEGRLSFDMDKFSQNRGLQLNCGESTYWLPFFKLDYCFKNNEYSAPNSCTVKCKEDGKWCSYKEYS